MKNFVSRDLGKRDVAVDAFRGLAIMAMILVNHAPPTDQIYSPLVHPEWMGWTLADTIFPAFLFLVGVSISISISSGSGARDLGLGLFVKIFRRTLILIVLSVLLVNFPYYEPAKFTLDGTLARIGWCYLFASILYLTTAWRTQLYLIVAIVACQWALLEFLSVPGFGSGVITPQGNASHYVDELVFGSYASWFRHDGLATQGVLPILSSLATTLVGVVTGDWLQSTRENSVKIGAMFAVGVLLLVFGMSWGHWYPISKPLWTGSYVLLMAGISLQLMAILYWLIDYCGYRDWALPLQVAGMNALFFYVFAQCLQRLLVYGRLVGGDGGPVRFRYYIYENWILPWAPGKAGALVYALCFLLVCYAVVLVLYRKRIFIKL